MKIVCLGDSLTAGMDREADSHWLNILKREAVHTYINKGICGDTTSGMLSRFYRDVVEEGAKSVILMGGGNDFIVGADVGSVQANMMSLVHQAFFCQIIPVIGIEMAFDSSAVREDWAQFVDFKEVEAKAAAYRKWIWKFAKTFHVEVLDFHQAFLDHATQAWGNYFSDGVHPNEKGNRIMADVILRAGM